MKRLTTNFKNFYFSQLFANTSDILYIVALIAHIYTISQSATLSALIPICITIGIFLSGFLAPFIYSKFLKKHILMTNQLFKVVLLILIIVCMGLHSELKVYYAVAFFIAFLDGFINPLSQTLIPYIEEKENVMYANAQMSILNNTIQIAGWALGGVLLSLLGPSILILLCVIFSFISVVFINLLVLDSDQKDDGKNILESFSSLLETNLSNQWSRLLNFTAPLEALLNSVWIAAILLVFVKEYLKQDDLWFGFINACFFLGLLLGGAAIKSLDKILSDKTGVILITLTVVISIITILFGINHYLFISLLLSLIYGIFEQIKSIVLHSKVQTILEENALLDTYTFYNMNFSICFCLSTLFVSKLADISSVNSVYIFAGIVMLFEILLFTKSKNIMDKKTN